MHQFKKIYLTIFNALAYASLSVHSSSVLMVDQRFCDFGAMFSTSHKTNGHGFYLIKSIRNFDCWFVLSEHWEYFWQITSVFVSHCDVMHANRVAFMPNTKSVQLRWRSLRGLNPTDRIWKRSSFLKMYSAVRLRRLFRPQSTSMFGLSDINI